MEVEQIEATAGEAGQARQAASVGEVGGTCFRVILPTRRPPDRRERSTARQGGRPRRPAAGEATYSSREEGT